MSLKRSASQVSPQVLSLLTLYPNIPDEPPRARSLVASTLGFVGLGCCASRVSYCCLGGFRLTRARAHGVLYSGTLSAREMGLVPCPTGSLTARVLGNDGSALPWVSTCLSPLLILCQSSPGTALVSSRTGSSQQSPVLRLRLTPSATPQCFPISDAMRVYLVDSFIARGPQYNAHTTSLILTLSGHTFSG